MIYTELDKPKTVEFLNFIESSKIFIKASFVKEDTFKPQKSKVLRRINEAEDLQANLPSNYQDMSKEELIKLMSGKKDETDENEKVEVAEGSDDVSKFISKLLESREMAQVYHWTVKGDMGSHAAHLALEAYYDGVIEHIDEIVEVYQGQYGIIEGYDVTKSYLYPCPMYCFEQNVIAPRVAS